jgi:hypothetical protein
MPTNSFYFLKIIASVLLGSNNSTSDKLFHTRHHYDTLRSPLDSRKNTCLVSRFQERIYNILTDVPRLKAEKKVLSLIEKACALHKILDGSTK